MDARQGIEQAAAVARGAERAAAPWVEKLARFGYAAKGVVYILIGFIAARAALRGGGDVEGWNGALESLRDEPFGTAMLWLIGLGLAGYVVWRSVAAIRDPEHDGAGHRVFYAVSALVHTGLALAALRLAAGSSESSPDTHWTSTLLDQPFGRVLVALAGAVALGYGVHQLRRAWTAKLDDRLDLSRLSPAARTAVVRFARFGVAARAVVLLILGYIFLRAAMNARASESGNMEGVLESMRDKPWLLGAIALGLIGYGTFNVVRARYRRIRAA